MTEAMDKNNFRQRCLFWAVIFFISIILVSAGAAIFNSIYQNKIFPGVWAANINLGGRTPEEALILLQKKTDIVFAQDIPFVLGKREINISSLVKAPTDPDLVYELFAFDLEKTIESAYRVGRTLNFYADIKERFLLLFYPRRLLLQTQIKEEKLKEILLASFPGQNIPSQDAKLEIKFEDRTPIMTVLPEKAGQTLDLDNALTALKKNLGQLTIRPINLQLIPAQPQLRMDEAMQAIPQVIAVLNKAPFFLRSGEQKVEIQPELLAQWLALRRQDNAVKIDFNQQRIREDLSTFVTKVEIPSQDAKFQIQDGKVVFFQPNYDGIAVNWEKSLATMSYYLFQSTVEGAGAAVEIATTTLPVAVKTKDVNTLGIAEIIGTGWSNFRGSPKNRRHNIKVGADSLSGILIKPGEEFSLNIALGEVNAETGYLPELVIKGDKTEPEFGGGLCQIATTMFRVALASGLPIIERAPHAYRVGYYEPAGVDATIYSPHPDVRFINNTGNYILIQSRIEGDNLYFDFWGTKDGRIIEQTKPVIFNFVKPPPPEITETTELKPGAKECKEQEHTGADTKFTYTVTYPNSEVKTTIFRSHYKPWQAKCLLGVVATSTPAVSGDITTPPALTQPPAPNPTP